MELSEEQKRIVENDTSTLVLSGAGTGKTVSLIHKVDFLLSQGVPAEDILVLSYSLRGGQVLLKNLQKKIGQKIKGVRIGTFRDFAVRQIEASSDGEKLKIADERQFRRILRQAMWQTKFDGTSIEAEHIVRSFKGRARKPEENEKFYDLFYTYKQISDLSGLIDRFDVVRKALVEMRSGKTPVLPVKHILVDDIQDITRIQYLWLLDHVKAGAKLYAFGDDDVSMFEDDGSLGAGVFSDLDDIKGMERYPLSYSFRSSAYLGRGLQTVLLGMEGRLRKNIAYNHDIKARIEHYECRSGDEELDLLLKHISLVPSSETVAVLTRFDWQAVRIHRYFEKNKLPHSSFAHSIWTVPGAIVILDLLHIFLNEAENRHLRNVLVAFGFTANVVDMLFSQGLQAKGWLEGKADLPAGVELSSDMEKLYKNIKSQLCGYYELIRKGQITPQDAFKASAYDMVMCMGADDKRNALVAIEKLLELKGDLKASLPKVRKVLPVNVEARLVVAPVRDVRGMDFDWVFMPFSEEGSYPNTYHQVLTADESRERRTFYAAMSKVKKGIVFSNHQTVSPYVSEVMSAVNLIKSISQNK